MRIAAYRMTFHPVGANSVLRAVSPHLSDSGVPKA